MRRAVELIARALVDAAFSGLAIVPPMLVDPMLGWIGRLLIYRYPGEPAFIAGALARRRPVAVRIAARARANLYRARVDVFRYVHRPVAPGCTEVRGELHLRAAYAQGNGVILATIHTTAMYPALWSALELAPRMGYRVHVVGGATPPTDKRMADFAYTVRASDQVRLSRAPLDALLAGAALLLPVDVLTAYGDTAPLRSHWVETRFLGSRAVFSTGAATLSRRTRAPIVPTVALRAGPGRYTVTFLQAIPPSTNRDHDRDVMHRLFAALEAVVRAHPDQYCWWLYAWAAPPPEAGRGAGRSSSRR